MSRLINIFLAWLIFSSSALAGLPPTTIQGQSGTKQTTFNFQVPNRQATQTGGVNQLIETGNLNLLANPSFEHQTVSSGWSVVAGTTSAETSLIQAGLKAISLTRPTTGPISLSQSVNTSFLSGQQGFISCRVRTNQPSMRICPVVNGVTQTDICSSVAPSASYFNYRTAFLFGSSTSGLIVESTANGTGTTLVDDCTLQLAQPSDFIDVAQIGPWVSYTPTFTGFGTVVVSSVFYRINGSSIDVRGRFTVGTPTAVEARLSLPSGFTSSSQIPAVQIAGIGGRSATASTESQYVLIEPSVTYLTFGFQATTTAPLTKQNGSAAVSSGNDYSFFASIPVQGLSNKITTYSQFAVSDVSVENVFSAYSTDGASVGTVSRENLDWINGNGTNPSAGQYVFTFQSGIFTQTPNCSVTARAVSGANAPVACSPIAASTNSTQLAVDCRQGGTVGDFDFEFICTKQGADYKAKNVITGTFQDVVTSPGAGKPVFYSFYKTGSSVVQDDYGDLVNGNCSFSANLITCPFNSGKFSSRPNCTVASFESTSARSYVSTLTTSQIIFAMLDGTGTGINANAMVMCHGIAP